MPAHGVRDSDATLHETDVGLFEDKLWLPTSVHHFRLFGDDDQTLNHMEKDAEQQRGGPPPGLAQEKEDPNLVTWDGPDDPGNPMNWPLRKKMLVTFTFSMTTFVITFSSSVFSTATQVTAVEFGVSEEVMTLGTSLFVLVRGVLRYLRTVLLTSEGLCHRALDMGPLFGTLRPDDPAVHWVYRYGHLTDPGRRRNECRNHHDHPFLGRSVWLRSTGYRGRRSC